jgi:GT2 family glycosyltransferase
MGLAASIIIPTHNRADILRHSLPRLFVQTVPQDSFEIIVVDDASGDGTAIAVESFARPNLLYRRQEVNRGAGAARNVAIATARSGLLVFLDDDAFVLPDYLERHLAAHRNAPSLIATGPIVEVSEIPPAGGEPGRFGGWHGNPFPTGNASVNRNLVLEAGGFDESFGIYGWEDSELHRRLMRLGARGRYVREAPIFHYKPQAVRQNFAERLKREKNRGAMGAMFYAKHPAFAVGWQTKQLGGFYALDRFVDGVLGLSALAECALATGEAPSSALMRLLVINHMEIDSGRREWNRLGDEGRRAMARETREKVKPSSRPR